MKLDMDIHTFTFDSCLPSSVVNVTSVGKKERQQKTSRCFEIMLCRHLKIKISYSMVVYAHRYLTPSTGSVRFFNTHNDATLFAFTSFLQILFLNILMS